MIEAFAIECDLGFEFGRPVRDIEADAGRILDERPKLLVELLIGGAGFTQSRPDIAGRRLDERHQLIEQQLNKCQFGRGFTSANRASRFEKILAPVELRWSGSAKPLSSTQSAAGTYTPPAESIKAIRCLR